MINQAWQTFEDFNRTDVAGLFVYSAEIVPIFTPMLLFALFTIVLLATYFSQRRTTGRGDFFASFSVAGYFTVVVAFLMSLVDGLIDITTLSIVVVIAIIGTILLLISKK